ncbi:hypothetical protein GCM10023116_17370 [Kistimonas scapharcae]|uniref:Uncharacterized protein n=1 Tax=Kistimonas scapharcae TaxID=1036133 RepID=A0ABP8V206_9GAMM
MGWDQLPRPHVVSPRLGWAYGAWYAAGALQSPRPWLAHLPAQLTGAVRPTTVRSIGVTAHVQTEVVPGLPPAREPMRYESFLDRVAASTSLAELNDLVEAFTATISNNWDAEEHSAFLWGALIKRVREIIGNNIQHQSFLAYSGMAGLIDVMARNLHRFTISRLSFLLYDLAYILKKEKKSGVFSQQREKEIVKRAIVMLFSGVSCFISDYGGDTSDNEVGRSFGRFYTALVIMQPFGFFSRNQYMDMAKDIIQHLNILMDSLDARAVRDGIWCISKGIDEGIHEIGMRLLKAFLDRLLQHADVVAGGYDVIDFNAVLSSLLKLIKDESHEYFEKRLCVHHVDCVVSKILSKNLYDANVDDLWSILCTLVEINEKLPNIDCVKVVSAYERLLDLSRSKLVEVASIYNKDLNKEKIVLKVLRYVGDKSVDCKVYFPLFDAFFEGFLGALQQPLKAWPIWHLNHLYQWVSAALTQYVPTFQGNASVLQEWKHLMLCSWLELFAQIMMAFHWKLESAEFDRDATGENYKISQAYEFFKEVFSDGKLKEKFEILLYASRRKRQTEKVNIAIARFYDAALERRYSVCDALVGHISYVFNYPRRGNGKVILYGSSLLVEYCVRGLFKCDINAFFSSPFALFVNDFDFLVDNEDVQKELFDRLCLLPSAVAGLLVRKTNEYTIVDSQIMLNCKEVIFEYEGQPLINIAVNYDVCNMVASPCLKIAWKPYLMFGDYFYINHDPGALLELFVPDSTCCSELVNRSLLSGSWQRKNRTLLNLLVVCFCEERLGSVNKVWQMYLQNFYQTHGLQVVRAVLEQRQQNAHSGAAH